MSSPTLYLRLDQGVPGSVSHPPTAILAGANSTNLALFGPTDGKALSRTPGSSQTGVRINGTTSMTGDCAGIQLISPPLRAQTIAAGSWQFAFAIKDSLYNDSYPKVGLYLANGSDGSLKTAICDWLSSYEHTGGSDTELTAYLAGDGAEATAADGDFLVLELGDYDFGVDTYDFTLYSGGTTAIGADQVATSDALSLITAPHDIYLLSEAPPAARVCVIQGTFRDSQGNVLAGTTLTWQLIVDNPGKAPVIYHVVGDSVNNGTLVASIPFTTVLDEAGSLGSGVKVFAPQDLALNVNGTVTATTAKYLVTGPNGIAYTTQNFAHSGTAIDFGDIVVNDVAAYTQAAVHIRNVTPQDIGYAVTVTASISEQCSLTGFAGQIIVPATQFSVLLDSNGDGDLLLAPNAPASGGITVPVNLADSPDNVVWWISINGAPRFPIQVPAAGGEISDLIVTVNSDGSVSVPSTIDTLGAVYAAARIYAAEHFS